MANIAIISDLDEGHLFPSFGLSGILRQEGHEVFYLTTPDNLPYLDEHGFQGEAIFREQYPAGYKKKQKTNEQSDHSPEWEHLYLLAEGELDEIIHRRNPDLLVISYFLPIETLLLHYKYGIPQVIYTTFLREPFKTPFNNCIETILRLSSTEPRLAERLIAWFEKNEIAFSSLLELAEPLKQMSEIVTCPRELDFPDLEFERTVSHIGPPLRHPGDKTDSLTIPTDKTILYGSFGSQTSFILREKASQFIGKLLEVMRSPAAEGWHLFLCVGDIIDAGDYARLAGSNVTMMKWVPQIEILKHASLTLTHGGLGTIRECIHFEVPMIIFPVINDAFANGDRVEFHRLGKTRDLDATSAPAIAALIAETLADLQIRENIRIMKRKFIQNGVDIASSAMVRQIIGNSLAIESKWFR